MTNTQSTRETELKDIPSEDFSELPKINDTNLLEEAWVWQPTPWDLIEVSNDGEKWYKRKYTGMWLLEQYACEWDFTTWIYARPAPEELKPLPEYKANRIAPDGRHKLAHPNRNEVQLELLTTTVNLLIDKLNNK